MVLAAETWGISGPTFLGLYAVLAVAVGIGAFVARQVVSRRGPRDVPDVDLAATPIDAAYLNRGATLAVLAACGALKAAGALSIEPGRLVVARPVDLPPDLPRLSWYVHQAAARPVRLDRLADNPPIAAELREISDRLTRSGLLAAASALRAQRAIGLLLVAVLAVGVVRLAAGTANGRPVGNLVLLLIGTAIAAIAYQATVKRVTPAGQRALERVRRRNHALSPGMKPSWSSYGPNAAALSVGAFGVAALWAADPGFAGGLGLSQPSTGGSSGSSDSGSSSSSCSGGSSCGGGGGCGG